MSSTRFHLWDMSCQSLCRISESFRAGCRGIMNSSPATIGVLASGGLDSSILLAHLLGQGHRVQPFYIRKGLYWQEHELAGLRKFLHAMATPSLLELVVLDLPLADLYSGHW